MSNNFAPAMTGNTGHWSSVYKAYLACGWCMFEGYKREGANSTHFDGYAKAAEQAMMGLECKHFDGYAKAAEQAMMGLECKVGDDKLQLSDSAQHKRARLVEGFSIQTSCRLQWLLRAPPLAVLRQLQRLWELPVYHTGQCEIDHCCVCVKQAIKAIFLCSMHGCLS